ncbi:MAG TPA: glycosyltransferase family 2 protein [Gemmatimonadaceae bacterium]|nr:glycosyltransferase family 2 protein [Gemmatimonadaceae bacterium]
MIAEPERRFLSVISPCYNESDVIGLFYDALKPVLESLDNLEYEILLVDDGSADDTLDKLNEIASRDKTVRVCSLSRNFGHQITLTAGLDHAAGDAVIMMDSDLQHPPTLIPTLVAKWREGADIVSAIRLRTEGETFFKGASSRGFYWLLNSLSGTKVPAGAADFCLISRRVADSLMEMPERHRFLRGLISWVGFRRVLVPYEATQRAAGHTKYSLVKMVTLALDAVFSFSVEPLRLALRAGLTVTFGGFIYLAWTLIYGYAIKGLVPGYASLIGVIMILGGSQLIFIGLIGQYLARVFEQVKGRPIYLLKQEPDPPRRHAKELHATGLIRHSPELMAEKS